MLALAPAGPAGAHIEVHAEGAQAGTGPVTLSFSAESESPTVGIVGVKTQLPPGIEPGDVSLAAAPAGWVLTPTGDGFQIGGPELPAGEDAAYDVVVAQLPQDATELVFPTLQYYADGREDAWIEPVTEAIPEPDKPAPVLTVAPAPAAAPGPPSTSAPDDPTTSTPGDDATPETPDADESGGVSTATWAVLGIAALGVLLGAGLWARRRAARERPPARR